MNPLAELLRISDIRYVVVIGFGFISIILGIMGFRERSLFFIIISILLAFFVGFCLCFTAMTPELAYI